MNYVFATLLYTFGILACFYVAKVLIGKYYKKIYYRAFAVTALGSALWSFGFATMLVPKNDAVFAIARIIGYFGMFIFLISCQILLTIIGGYPVRTHNYFFIETIIGVFAFGGILAPGNYRIVHGEYGVVTELTNSFVSIFYTGYTIIVALVFIFITINMLLPNKPKKIRAFSVYILFVEIMVVLGMVIDTVLPALGTNYNIPASTLLQFCGLVLVDYSIKIIEKNSINFDNLSGYMYDSLKSSVLVYDSKNRLCIANKTAMDLFDIDDKNKELMENSWQKFFAMDPPEDIEHSNGTIIINSELPVKGLLLCLFIDKIYDDYGDYAGYIVFISDVTQPMTYMREIEKSKNEAMRANEAKSLFLANMSHEIRTPMNSILGFSQLALNDKIDDVSREYFTDIRNSAESLLAIINDVLDISRIESGKVELIAQDYSCSDLFNEVHQIIKVPAQKKGLEFRFDIAPDFPNRLCGDKAKMREILINLLNNAVKYTKNGYVRFKADFIKSSDNEGTAHFEISDSGIGIKEEDQEKIFSIFSRIDSALNSNTEGTGLGLSITKGFIDLMKGKISVKSTFGAGSTFFVDIPQVIIDGSPIIDRSKEESNSASNLVFKDINVLAVDDNKVNLKVISKLFDKCKLTIDTADSGEKAIEAAKAKAYDIILMDQMMPGMDGVEAMHIIRSLGGIYETNGETKIVALTANVIEGTKESLIAEGFDEYLGKPLDFEISEKVLTSLLPEDKYCYE